MRCHEMVEMNRSSIPFEGIHYPLILGYLTTIPKLDRLLAGNSSFFETAISTKQGGLVRLNDQVEQYLVP